MNILTLIKTHPKRIGGIERWLIDHTANLVKKGHSHTVYFEDTPADVVKNALVEAGADVEVYAFDRQWLKSLMKLRRTVKETQADVVHMHFYAPIIGSMSFVLWLMGIPLVVHYRISGEPSKPGTLAKVLKKARFYLLGRSIKKVVCVSAYTQSKFLTDYQVPSALTEVVHNGISDSVQPPPCSRTT
jgi:glycosyltransferase involved in cell wall biosynthesis